MPDLRLIGHLIDGHADDVSRLVREALDAGVPAETILEEGLIAGMTVVGIRFRDNEIFVPEVLVSARAMKAGLAHLEPVFSRLRDPARRHGRHRHREGRHPRHRQEPRGHDAAGRGLQHHRPRREHDDAEVPRCHRGAPPQIVGMSALLTTTMGQMKVNIEAFRDAGLDVRVMVGGAPVSAEYAERIGADAHGANATEAVEKALALVRPPASPSPP
jgi:5-methyltetrahydrofolate--homocysteine methyltransferase